MLRLGFNTSYAFDLILLLLLLTCLQLETTGGQNWNLKKSEEEMEVQIIK